MSSRVGFRFLNNTRFAFRNVSAPFRRPSAQGFRFQSSDAGAGAAEHQNPFQRLWNSPVGLKTVHFWCVYWMFRVNDMAPFSRGDMLTDLLIGPPS